MSTEILSIADLRSGVNGGSITIQDGARVSLDPSELIIDIDDPNSDEYAEKVLKVWSNLSGKSNYNAEVDEAFELDSQHFPSPWPYISKNPAAVASYMGAVAHTVGILGCEPPARVVELGSGWGHLALMIASTGYQTTAVDLNPASVKLLRARAKALQVELDVVEASFLDYRASEPVDCFVFYESFHHCAYPARLVSQCVDMLADDGRIVFTAEPFYESYHQPWGVRPDGHAAIMTAREGWLELGYSWDYMLELFLRHGLSPSRTSVESLGEAAGLFVVASKGLSAVDVGTGLLPSTFRATWDDASGVSASGAFATADGSKLVVPDSATTATVVVKNLGTEVVQVRVEAGRDPVSIDVGAGAVGEMQLAVDTAKMDLTVMSSLAPVDGLEHDRGVLVETVQFV